MSLRLLVAAGAFGLVVVARAAARARSWLGVRRSVRASAGLAPWRRRR